MKKDLISRWMIYAAGLIILALGIVMNTKIDLGVSPIISVSYSISRIIDRNFGNVTFLLYTTFVLIEIVIHIYKKWFTTIPKDLLQIPLSLIFTRFMNVFSSALPDFDTDLAGTAMDTIGMKILFLAIAVILTGMGAAMSLDVRLIPNPGDGLVQAIADLTGMKVGTGKNFVDITCVITASLTGLLLTGSVVGIGVGTLFTMIFTGRVVAVFNHFCLDRINAMIPEDTAH